MDTLTETVSIKRSYVGLLLKRKTLGYGMSNLTRTERNENEPGTNRDRYASSA